jgi:hypothetical protein
LEDADAEAQGKKKPGEAPEAEDEVELDDESLDDAAFIQESEEGDADVTEIIGGDIDIDEGTWSRRRVVPLAWSLSQWFLG